MQHKQHAFAGGAKIACKDYFKGAFTPRSLNSLIIKACRRIH